MRRNILTLYLLGTIAVSALSCSAKDSSETTSVPAQQTNDKQAIMRKTYTDEEIAKNGWEKATFAGGCFWCMEAVFEEVDGVKSVVSGYAGGHTKNPTYQAVCSDTTGYAETIQIVYDPKETNYNTLLDIFMKVHDPTTLNQQGPDQGTQYRSVIFYHNDTQKTEAEAYIKKLDASHYYDDPIVTQVVPFTQFYPAEDYHQDYYLKNPDQPYCQFVVKKKVDKFEHLFPDLVKPEYK